jgi:hypothetical protein
VHEDNYVNWKSASKSGLSQSSLGSLLLNELTAEASNWKNILGRILEVMLFLSERGLAFFGSNEHIGNTQHDNFLGIVELLSKYDPVLNNHVKRVRQPQKNHKRLQVHYLPSYIQN